MIPEGWRSARLGDVADMNARTLPSDTDPNEVLRYVDLSTVKEGRLVAEPAALRFAEAPSRARRRLAAGDSIVSTVRPQLRGMAFFAAAEPDLVVSTGFAVLSPRSDIDPAFLFQNVRRQEFTDFLCTRMKGSNYPAVNASDVADAPLLLPPLAEQRRIAAVLQAADDAVAAAEAVIEQTEKVKRGLVEQLLTSTDWPTRRICEVGDVQLGQQKHPKFAEGTNVRPYLRVANVLDGRIDFTDLKEMHFPERELEKFELRAGDILLNEGQSTHLVGRSAVYRGEVPGICVQKTLLRYRPGPSLLADFAQCVFEHWLHTGVFAGIAVQTTSMAHLTAVRFNQMRIPVPPLPEQRRIVDLAAAAVAEPATIEALGSVRTGLAADLLSGRVRVPA